MSDCVSEQLLLAVDRCLRNEVRPRIDDETGRNQLDFAIRLVDFVRRRIKAGPGGLEDLLAQEGQLLDALMELSAPDEDEKSVDRVPTSSIDALEADRCAREALLAEAMPALVAAVSRDPGGTTWQHLRDFVTAQEHLTAALDPKYGVGSATFLGADPVEGGSPPIDENDGVEEKLARYLEQRFPGQYARAERLTVISGGYSKKTIFVTILRDSAEPLDAVIRMDVAGHDGRSVAAEYPLLKLLHAQGLPVPQIFWLESDRRHLGGAFTVMSRCDGKSDASDLFADDSRADSFARDLAALMAKLHAVDVAGLEPEAASRSAADFMREEVQRWYDIYRESEGNRHPLLDLSYQWLLGNIPPHLADVSPCMVHGDIGFHNLLIADGVPTALLDWETAHLGDPAEDLYYTKAYLDPLISWDRFLEYYTGAGGRPCPPSSRQFYSVWRGARIAANCARVKAAFKADASDAAQQGVLAYLFGRRLELEAARRTIDALS